jgi:hypothetical protein
MEHTLSILAHSYTEAGGMNAATGGDRGMLANAINNAREDTWQNGLRALVEQDVFEDGLKEVKTRHELEIFAEQCEAMQDEIDKQEEVAKAAAVAYGESCRCRIQQNGKG